MAIEPGQQLLHYRLAEKIGEGGMGQVWRATDTTLDREVAIKILPDAFVRDPERLARFEREAKLLASLSHPNIAVVHGFHEAEGLRFIAMELVAGEDLSCRLNRGRPALDESLSIARDVAAALEAAHDNGVIHRDLKPANVQLTPGGSVKVLDFGLAKAADTATATAASGASPSLSPTMTSAGTQAGMILGTASYMSPEQASGQPVDRRCDIWSYGVLLHELFSGKRLFDGETISHTLAAVLRDDIDLDQLPKSTPRQLKQLIKRCLERDATRRLRDIGEARILLDDLTQGGVDERESTEPPTTGTGKLPWLIAAVSVIALIVFAVLQLGGSSQSPQTAETFHVEIAPPPGTHYDLHHGTPAVSPDGRSVAFIARDEEGRRHLWVRDLREPAARRLENTEGASMPFWSPDGEHLGFSANHLLKRVPARGGPVDTVMADFLDLRGGTWTSEGKMLVGVSRKSAGLYRVTASGGTPEPVTQIDAGVFFQGYPYPIPGTDAVLMTHRSGQGNALMVKDGEAPPRELMPADSNVVYVEPGFILFWREGALRVQPFDKTTLQPTGEQRLVVPGVATDPSNLVAHFSVEAGTLVYIAGAEADGQSRLVLRNREGKEIGTVGPPGNFYAPELSPDGGRVAVDNSGDANNGDIWIYELDRPVGTRVSRHPADESDPVWSPDGKQIAFWSMAEGDGDVYLHRVGESGEPVRLVGDDQIGDTPHDWSADGNTIVMSRGLQGEGDLWLYDMESGDLRRVVESSTREGEPSISPDGRFLAYTSDETDRDEVFLRSLEADGRVWQVSLEGGDGPRWRADGRELFFLGADGMLYSVDVALGDDVTLGRPQPLFRARARFDSGNQFDVSADGQTFLINSWMEEQTPRAMSVVLNWEP